MDLNEYILRANYLRELARSHNESGKSLTAEDLRKAADTIMDLVNHIKTLGTGNV